MDLVDVSQAKLVAKSKQTDANSVRTKLKVDTVTCKLLLALLPSQAQTGPLYSDATDYTTKA
jgi:hypothetical protein